jgi:hypothetical protein
MNAPDRQADFKQRCSDFARALLLRRSATEIPPVIGRGFDLDVWIHRDSGPVLVVSDLRDPSQPPVLMATEREAQPIYSDSLAHLRTPRKALRVRIYALQEVVDP